jgi:hypothetical protein
VNPLNLVIEEQSLRSCRCRVAEFKKNSAQWRSQVQAADALKKDFAEILDDYPSLQIPGGDAPEGEAEQPKKNRKKEKAVLPSAGEAHSHASAKANTCKGT